MTPLAVEVAEVKPPPILCQPNQITEQLST
ncbi:hypothetical protein FORC066_0435 [Yersinia enterocolitica]|nr:hypothetical protein FORC066_0435 [Yersinia enterocolitica]